MRATAAVAMVAIGVLLGLSLRPPLRELQAADPVPKEVSFFVRLGPGETATVGNVPEGKRLIITDIVAFTHVQVFVDGSEVADFFFEGIPGQVHFNTGLVVEGGKGLAIRNRHNSTSNEVTISGVLKGTS